MVCVMFPIPIEPRKNYNRSPFILRERLCPALGRIYAEIPNQIRFLGYVTKLGVSTNFVTVDKKLQYNIFRNQMTDKGKFSCKSYQSSLVSDIS